MQVWASTAPTARLFLVVASAAIALPPPGVGSFVPPHTLRHHAPAAATATSSPSTAPLSMAGAGMGMGTQPKGKKKKGGSKAKGTGKKSSDKYDVAKAMIKSEKLYDELMTASIKALNSDEAEVDITSEYIVAARCRPGATLAKKDNGALAAASDWIPVAQVVITRPIHMHEEDDGAGLDASVRQAISYYCREISYAATLSSPATFQSLPRTILEYSAEPLDSFVKYVYEDVVEGKAGDSFVEGEAKVDMTKSKAREVLGLDVGCKDAATIKRAYKTKSMEWHPDRFVNSDRTQEEVDASSHQFSLVKMAYEALGSGVREVDGNGAARSWYESLGGKGRTEFVGPLELMSVESAGAFCNKAFKSAVAGVDPDLTMAFVARNQAAAR